MTTNFGIRSFRGVAPPALQMATATSKFKILNTLSRITSSAPTSSGRTRSPLSGSAQKIGADTAPSKGLAAKFVAAFKAAYAWVSEKLATPGSAHTAATVPPSLQARMEAVQQIASQQAAIIREARNNISAALVHSTPGETRGNAVPNRQELQARLEKAKTLSGARKQQELRKINSAMMQLKLASPASSARSSYTARALQRQGQREETQLDIKVIKDGYDTSTWRAANLPKTRGNP